MTDILPSPGATLIRLEDLAGRANDEHRECSASAMTMLQHAIAAGETLIRAKAAMPYGEWGAWVRDHLAFSHSTAAAYMLVARHQAHLLACEDVTTIQKAILKLRDEGLTDPRGPKRQLPPGVASRRHPVSPRTEITDPMIERLAAWMMRKWGKGRPVTDTTRELAREALHAALGPHIAADAARAAMHAAGEDT